MSDTVPDGYFTPTELIIEADGLKIEVDQSMTATVSFDPAVSLPEEYHFTHYASYDDIVAVAEYLKKNYKEFIGFDNPQVNIHGGDYNIYDQQKYSIEFFNASGNKIEQMINYNFNRVTFHCDDEGKLFIARIYQPDLSEKVCTFRINGIPFSHQRCIRITSPVCFIVSGSRLCHCLLDYLKLQIASGVNGAH